MYGFSTVGSGGISCTLFYLSVCLCVITIEVVLEEAQRASTDDVFCQSVWFLSLSSSEIV